MSQNSAIFLELTSSFSLFVVKILATVAKTFTKIKKTERKAFDKERSALEVGLLKTCIFILNIGNDTKFCHFFEFTSFFLPYCCQNLGNRCKNIHEIRKDRAQGFWKGAQRFWGRFSKLVFLSCIWETSQNGAFFPDKNFYVNLFLSFFKLNCFFLPLCCQNLGKIKNFLYFCKHLSPKHSRK